MQPRVKGREQPRLAVSRSNIDQHTERSRLRRARGNRPAASARRGAPRRGVRRSRPSGCAPAPARGAGAQDRGRRRRPGGAVPHALGRARGRVAAAACATALLACAVAQIVLCVQLADALEEALVEGARRRGAAAVPRADRQGGALLRGLPAGGERSRRRPWASVGVLLTLALARLARGPRPRTQGEASRASAGAWRWGACLRRETVADRAVAWLGPARSRRPRPCASTRACSRCRRWPCGAGRGAARARAPPCCSWPWPTRPWPSSARAARRRAVGRRAAGDRARVRPGRRVLPLRVAAGGDPRLPRGRRRPDQGAPRRGGRAPRRRAGGGGGVRPRRRRARVELFVSIVDWTSLLLLGFTNFSLPLVLDVAWGHPGWRASGPVALRGCRARWRRSRSRASRPSCAARPRAVVRRRGRRQRPRGAPLPAGRMPRSDSGTPWCLILLCMYVFLFRPRPLPRGLSSGSCASSPAR